MIGQCALASREDGTPGVSGVQGTLGSRYRDGRVVFKDHPDFTPNLTPEMVLRAGAFGGGYFRDIYSSVTKKQYKDVWKELPLPWRKGLIAETRLAATTYDANLNKSRKHHGAKRNGL